MLAGLAATPVTLLMLVLLGTWVDLDWGRFHLWLLVVIVASVGVRDARNADRRPRP